MHHLQRGLAVIRSRVCTWRDSATPRRTPCTSLLRFEASKFIQQLRRHMDQLRPTPAARYSSPATFFLNDLQDWPLVFLRQDSIRRALEPPYSGPHKVVARIDKTLKIVVRGRRVKLSADRVKPAYVLDGTQHEQSSLPSAKQRSDPAKHVNPTRPTQTTRSGRTVHFPAHFIT